MTNTIEYPIHYPTMATVKEAAARFGVSPAYVRKLCRMGKFAIPLYHRASGWSTWTRWQSTLRRVIRSNRNRRSSTGSAASFLNKEGG